MARLSSPPSFVHRQTPGLSVVIVNYCQWENTRHLARQLLASASIRRNRAEVVIVDNHSSPHPLIRRLRRRPGLSLRRWRRNHGFARAANEGCRLSQGNWLLLLNPDLDVPPRFLDQVLALCTELEKEAPAVGVVGFQLRNGDGSRQRSCGFFPTLTTTLLGLFRPRHRRKYLARPTCQRQEVDWVTGCCLLVRRECLQQIGGFDEDFFLYYEDVDLCRRARARGWGVVFEPALQVVHHHPLHSRTVSPLLRLLTRHALLTYASKHWPRWQQLLLSGIIGLEARWRWLWSLRQGDRHGAGLFSQLADLAADLSMGRQRQARRRLHQLLIRFQAQAEATAHGLDIPARKVRIERQPVSRHPQPQSPRPAGALPAERVAGSAAGHRSPGGG